MSNVRIRGLDRSQRICRFLSFPQFAELMVLSTLAPPPPPDPDQLWLPAMSTAPGRQVLADGDNDSIVQVVTEVGALAEALCPAGGTELLISPAGTQLGADHPDVRLAARLAYSETAAMQAQAVAGRPMLVEVSRLLLAVRVAHGASARFVELITAMVRRHAWVDVSRLPAPR